MAKPYTHAVSSAKQFGGVPEDYLKYHEWMDQTKSFCADARHRSILHSSFGIFLGEQYFGSTMTNSNGRVISVRSILEQHCMEDYKGWIPSIGDFISCMKYEPWMNGIGFPPSHPRNCIQNVEDIKVTVPLERTEVFELGRPDRHPEVK